MTLNTRTELAIGEQYFTIPAAARRLNLPVSSLRRAVKAGLIPSCTALNSRKRVRLDQVLAALEESGEG